MADHIEMKPVDSELGRNGDNKPAVENQTQTQTQAKINREANLLELPGGGLVIGGIGDGNGEPDVEKGEPTAVATIIGGDEQQQNNDISPLTVPAPGEDHEAATPTNHNNNNNNKKKNSSVVPKLRFLAKNKFYVIQTVLVVALLAVTIALAVVISKGML